MKYQTYGEMTVGDVVEFVGCSKEQINWGNNDDTKNLNIGNRYIIEGVEVHRSHTKIKLQGIVGMFNSVCFVDVDDLLDL
jgi:hypothetical protein